MAKDAYARQQKSFERQIHRLKGMPIHHQVGYVVGGAVAMIVGVLAIGWWLRDILVPLLFVIVFLYWLMRRQGPLVAWEEAAFRVSIIFVAFFTVGVFLIPLFRVIVFGVGIIMWFGLKPVKKESK